MKNSKIDSQALQKDSLLGGAALSLSDLEIVESHEIKWLLNSKNNYDNIKFNIVA